ncbi:MAG: M23 family metallopeptidase [Nitratireductor sp.]|nr:M23 family metallopeptidase [Nitratireductor sp.]
MNGSREQRQFGRRESRIVISSNGKVREYRISANLLIVTAALFAMFMTGYIASTAYLAFREDLVAGTLIRQARMKHEYEDRIAALRAEVDRITSRQMLDQQAVEARVAALMRQQELLTGRNGALDGLLEKARKSGIDLPQPSTAGDAASGDRAELEIDPLRTGSVQSASLLAAGIGDPFALRGVGEESAIPGLEPDPRSDIALASNPPGGNLFGGVKDQIRSIEARQTAGLMALQEAARERMEQIAGIYDTLNIRLPGETTTDIGGPFIAPNEIAFDDLADTVGSTLDSLDSLKRHARELPVANPLPGAGISSRFGSRVDPFRRKAAFHAGIDFRATSGTPVRATGKGTVIHAGRKGGYGMMVEIDHGQGITSRYAHLSRILVKEGETVEPGTKIGQVGSTGRSTGPHLHYEIRRADKATNPARFINAGAQLRQYL